MSNMSMMNLQDMMDDDSAIQGGRQSSKKGKGSRKKGSRESTVKEGSILLKNSA